MRTRTSVTALLSALMLALTGCGGSDGNGSDSGGGDAAPLSDAERPYVDALATSLQTSDDDFPLTDDQVDCLAPRFVRVFGVDRLEDAGVSPETFADEESMDFSELSLTEKEGNALFDTFGACDIDLRETMLDSMASDEEVTPAMAECFETVLTDDNLRELMVTTMISGDEAVEDSPVMGELIGCAFLGFEE